MPSTILSDNGASSGTAGLKSTGSNDGQLVLQTTTAGGTATTAMTINTSQAVTFAQTANLPNTFGFKNRIINGGMVIDQRNAGAAVTVNDSNNFYPVDRFSGVGELSDGVYTLQQSTSTAPSSFINYLRASVTTVDASIGASQRYSLIHKIEGNNVADLGWGASGAQAVTLSFKVRSSVTGTFSGSVRNNAGNRSYPFTYTISSSNTWTNISVTISGDTTGTWETGTSTGLFISWDFGSGSSLRGTAGSWAAADYRGATGAVSLISTLNATWDITGVQLEAGSTATSFDYRDYGRELAMCQRYYYKQFGGTSSIYIGGVGLVVSTTALQTVVPFPTQMRIAPAALEQTGSASDYRIVTGAGVTTNCSAVPTFVSAQVWQAATNFTVSSGLTAGGAGFGRELTTSAFLAWSAEL